MPAPDKPAFFTIKMLADGEDVGCLDLTPPFPIGVFRYPFMVE